MIDLTGQRLLVVAPHPDDEVLGCGGLIRKVKSEGGKVYVLYMTVGDTKEFSQNGHSTKEQRLREIEKVAAYLHYDDYAIAFEGNEYHLQLDTIAQKEIIGYLEHTSSISLEKIQPTILATPYLSDYNQDHKATTKAIFSAARPAPWDTKPFQYVVLGYECVSVADWWSSPRNINTYLPLSDEELEEKITALSLFASQIRTGYHARSLHSIRTLAYFRGLHIGQKAAEAFYSYRLII